MRRTLWLALFVVVLTCIDASMSNGSAADTSRTWQTEKVKLLDDRKLINATVRVLNGALPGTNKQYDAQKVSDELVQMLLAELKDQSGVQAETALATLGALAGFSVQMGLRETLVITGKMPEDKVFTIVKTKTGDSFYFGDLPNEGLFGGQSGAYSVYALVGGGAQSAGAKQLPDIQDIARYVAGTVGSDKFGIPRVPAEHMPHQPAIELLNKFWNPTRNYLVLNVQAPLH